MVDINLTDLGPPINGEIPGLKDFFATSALSLFSNYSDKPFLEPSIVARVCYDVAEAMMKEKYARQNKESTIRQNTN